MRWYLIDRRRLLDGVRLRYNRRRLHARHPGRGSRLDCRRRHHDRRELGWLSGHNRRRHKDRSRLSLGCPANNNCHQNSGLSPPKPSHHTTIALHIAPKIYEAIVHRSNAYLYSRNYCLLCSTVRAFLLADMVWKSSSVRFWHKPNIANQITNTRVIASSRISPARSACGGFRWCPPRSRRAWRRAAGGRRENR